MGKHIVTVETMGGTEAIHDAAKKFVGHLKHAGVHVRKAHVQHETETPVDVTASPAVSETPAPSTDAGSTGSAAS